MEEQRRAADYVSQYAASLTVEVTEEMVTEDVQELLEFEPALTKCICATKVEYLMPEDGYQVEIWAYRRQDRADTIHVRMLMPFEDLIDMLTDEWKPYLHSWYQGYLLPAIRRDLQQSAYFKTNRIDRGGGWTEVVNSSGNKPARGQSLTQIILDEGQVLRANDTYTITTTAATITDC